VPGHAHANSTSADLSRPAKKVSSDSSALAFASGGISDVDRRPLGVSGRKLIEQKYSLAAQAESYVALPKTLLPRPNHRRSGATSPMPVGPALLAGFQPLIQKSIEDLQRKQVSTPKLGAAERERRLECLQKLSGKLRRATVCGRNYPRVLRETDRGVARRSVSTILNDSNHELLSRNGPAARRVDSPRARAQIAQSEYWKGVKVPTLPIGVVIPSCNSLQYLPAHLHSLREWTEMVEQIVVVDSNSTDGTLEYIRQHLTHPNLHIFSRPPGLYASWNYGIGQLSTKYTYICTVGESITPGGLRHLLETSERLGSDVCISRPQFLDMEGRTLERIRWPIHQIIEDLNVCEPRLLSQAEAVFYVLRGGGSGILGSSASNLYRTAVLQKNPFPTDYQSAGDTAWGLLNCCDVGFAVTPECFSTFLFHPTSHQLNREILRETFRSLGRTVLHKARPICDLSQFPKLKVLCELLDTTDRYEECKQALALYRSRVLWVLNWRAWQARAERNRLRQRLKELKRQCRS